MPPGGDQLLLAGFEKLGKEGPDDLLFGLAVPKEEPPNDEEPPNEEGPPNDEGPPSEVEGRSSKSNPPLG